MSFPRAWLILLALVLAMGVSVGTEGSAAAQVFKQRSKTKGGPKNKVSSPVLSSKRTGASMAKEPPAKEAAAKEAPAKEAKEAPAKKTVAKAPPPPAKKAPPAKKKKPVDDDDDVVVEDDDDVSISDD